jgi:hypothetical protein
MELNISKFFLEDSLYTEYDIKEIGFENLLAILIYYERFSITPIVKTIDSYCPICEKHTTFLSVESVNIDLSSILMKTGYHTGSVGNFDKLILALTKIGTFQRTFNCPRPDSDSTHDLVVVFKVMNSKVIKIGQNPSIADLSRKEIEKYRKLNLSIYSELNRAIGLASHGIGVGAFVYLRRILEKYIVIPRLLELVAEGKVDNDLIFKTDFKGKIELAKEKLPDFLVNNKKIHSFLSKGLHELEEKECKDYFALMRASIEIILDEEIEKIEKDKKRKMISDQLNILK